MTPTRTRTRPLALLALAAGLNLGAALAVNDTTGPPPSKPPCYDDCGVEIECEETGSYYWSLDCGEALFNNRAGPLAFFRAGIQSGGVFGGAPSSVHEIYKDAIHGEARSQVYLRIEVPKIQPSFFLPSNLMVTPGSNAEILRDGQDIRQIVTGDALTDVTALANDEGYQIRKWSLSGITLGAKAPYYPLPAGDPAIEVIFKKHPTTSTGFLKTSTTADPGGDLIVTTAFIEDDLDQDGTPDEFEIYHYDGADTTGDLLRKTQLTYSDRGAKLWDYTLERKIWEPHHVGGSLVALDPANPAANTLVTHTEEIYEDFSLSASGGEAGASRLVSRKSAFGSAHELTETWEYHASTNLNIHGRLKQHLRPDGSWDYYTYADNGGTQAIIYHYSSYNDLDVTQRAAARLETNVIRDDIITYYETVGGVQVRKRLTYFNPDVGGLVQAYTQHFASATEILTTLERFYPDDYGSTAQERKLAGRRVYRRSQDYTIETWGYTHLAGEKLQITPRGRRRRRQRGGRRWHSHRTRPEQGKRRAKRGEVRHRQWSCARVLGSRRGATGPPGPTDQDHLQRGFGRLHRDHALVLRQRQRARS